MPAEIISSFDGPFRFLSNFHPSPIHMCGWRYDTVEHAYQALKMIDYPSFEAVRSAITPGISKRLARKLPLRSDWEEVKVPIMLECVRAKFDQNPLLRGKLLATGDSFLVEGNTWGDRFWGVCQGVGENYLGKILMQVRKELNAC